MPFQGLGPDSGFRAEADAEACRGFVTAEEFFPLVGDGFCAAEISVVQFRFRISGFGKNCLCALSISIQGLEGGGVSPLRGFVISAIN